MIDLVPAWSDCALDREGALDPPRALSPAPALVPVPTSSDPNNQKIPATPSPPMGSLPVETGAKHPHDRDQTTQVGSFPTAESPSDANLPSKTKPSTTPEHPHEAAPSDDSQAINGPAQYFHGVPTVSGTSKTSVLHPGESSEYSSLSAEFPPDTTIPVHLDPPADLESITAVSSHRYELISSPASSLIEIDGDFRGQNPSGLDPEGPFGYIQGSAEESMTTKDFDPPAATNDGSILAVQAHNSNSFGAEPIQKSPPAMIIGGQKITNNADPTTIRGARVLYRSGDLKVGNYVYKIPAAAGQGQRPRGSMVAGGLTFSFIPAAVAEVSAKQGFLPIVEHSPTSVIINDKDNEGQRSATYITVGGQTFSIEPNAVQVAGKTILPGDSVVTVNSMQVQDGRSDLVIGTLTERLPLPSADITPQESLFTVGHDILTLKAKKMIVGRTTLQPGDPPITIDGTPIYLGSSDFVIGTHTQNLATANAATAPDLLITVGDKLMTPKVGNIIVGGSTLRPGDPAITIDGALVRLQSSDVIIGTRTERLPSATMDAVQVPLITIGTEVITPEASNIVFGGSTLRPGDPPITIDGTLVRLESSDLVIGTRTERFPLVTIDTPQVPLITIGNEVITPEAGDIIVGGSTLTPGGKPITIDGIPISLGSSVIIAGSQTTDFTLSTPTPSPTDSGDTSARISPALSTTASEAVNTAHNKPSSGYRIMHMLGGIGKTSVSIIGCFAVTVAAFAAYMFE